MYVIRVDIAKSITKDLFIAVMCCESCDTGEDCMIFKSRSDTTLLTTIISLGPMNAEMLASNVKIAVRAAEDFILIRRTKKVGYFFVDL